METEKNTCIITDNIHVITERVHESGNSHWRVEENVLHRLLFVLQHYDQQLDRQAA